MSDIFASQSVPLARSQTWVISFSTTLRASVLAKPVKLGILTLISLVLVS